MVNGKEAVEAVGQERFDLILMDSRMPEMSGAEAAAAIRAIDGPAGAVPIIAVTAEAMRGNESAALAAGMNAYATKPIDPDHLLSLVERFCAPQELSPGGTDAGI